VEAQSSHEVGDGAPRRRRRSRASARPGATGASGPAGPTLIASGIVTADGRVIESQGVIPTIAHANLGPGANGFTITFGSESGCPVPALTAFGSPTFLYFMGGDCINGTFSGNIETGTGADTGFSYVVVGAPPASAAAVALRPASPPGR